MLDDATDAIVEKAVAQSKIYTGDTAPENPEVDALWLDTTDPTCNTFKRWNGEEWVETSITQDKIDSVDGIIQSQSQEIEMMQGQISLRVTKEDYQIGLDGKLDADWVDAVYASELNQTAENIEMVFTKSKEYTNDSVSGLNTFKEEVQTYQRFSADGLELGKINDPFKVRLDNEKLSFLDNEVEVAYVSNKRLHITDARVTNSLSVGTDANGYFDWVTEAAGLGMKWKTG